MEDG
jgi:sorting nexin-1/2